MSNWRRVFVQLLSAKESDLSRCPIGGLPDSCQAEGLQSKLQAWIKRPGAFNLAKRWASLHCQSLCGVQPSWAGRMVHLYHRTLGRVTRSRRFRPLVRFSMFYLNAMSYDSRTATEIEFCGKSRKTERKDVAQGRKPDIFSIIYGPTKVVPSHKTEFFPRPEQPYRVDCSS